MESSFCTELPVLQLSGVLQGDTASADEAQARQTQLNVRFQAWLARTEAIISKVCCPATCSLLTLAHVLVLVAKVLPGHW